MNRAAIFSLFLILGQSLIAQNISNKARFSVDYIHGCAPLTVNLTDLATEVDNGAPILVHFNRNPADPESLSGIINPMLTGGTIDTTYTTPGTYLIGQVNGNVADPANRFDFIQVVVTEPVQPVFTVSTCTNNSITIDFDFNAPGDDYDSYLVDFGNGQSTTVLKTDPSTLSYNYASQNTYTITVTGQLTDGFNGSCAVANQDVTTILNLPLPQITEVAVLSPSSVQLTYSALENNIGYELEIDDGSGFQSTTLLSPINNTTEFTFDDSSFDFQSNTYTIRISATEACGNSTGFSNSVPTIALNSNAEYAANSISVTFRWTTIDIDLIELFLIENGTIHATSMDIMGNTNVIVQNCTEMLTYQVEGNFMGTVSRSILLSPDLSVNLTPPAMVTPEIVFSSGDLLVRWLPPNVNASQYIIYRQASGGVYEQIGNSNTLQYLDNGLTANSRQVCYRISYLDDCGNESEQSIEICENLSNQVLLPTAFTPNGDGLNDTFRVLDGVYRNFQMNIYNKWGTLVFATSNSANGWDGSINGQLAPPGAYLYRIEYFDTSDRIATLTGSFLLIR